MKRLIKYRRAYFKDEAKTQFAHFKVWGVNIRDRESVWPGGDYGATYYTDLQFTGLHDKNGKEIYEGDIFKYEKHPGYLVDTFISSVKWLEESACYGYQVWPYANQAHEFFSPFSTHDELKEDFLSHLEVIGNVYENSELLTPLP